MVLLVSVVAYAAVSTNISSGQQSTKLQAAARDIASALRYAHGQALVTRMPTNVAINLDKNSYQIGDHPKVYRFPLDIDVSVTVAEQEYSKAENEIASIRFFADGSSTGGRITLVWGKQLRRLDVNWITGEVTISEKAA